MLKLARGLTLAVLVAGLSSAAVLSIAPAQEKGKKEGKLGTVEYYKNDKGKWRYVIKDDNGKTIAMPLPQISFENKDECLKQIEFIKDTLAKVKPTERKKDVKD